jgi:hypothetical protein
MTAHEMPTMVVSRLLATVGIDTAKIRLAVPAKKLPSAALIKSNQLVRESIADFSGLVQELSREI